MTETALDRLDIIIPVYRGEMAVRRCLDSVLASKAMEIADLVIINDASPEPGVTAFLDELATKQSITLINHDINQGFVTSVNAGAALNPQRDFVILNADTEVAGDWLHRLRQYGADYPMAATVTPFSNNATIASYPHSVTDNALPCGAHTKDLHERFAEVNGGQVLEMPTAVGFCTWIRRGAWQEADGFDPAFGRGYGEEVDFCCKLSSKGWQHLLATDVFVYHEGGVSFGSEASERKINAQKLVDQRYPDYSESVQRWIRQDPAQPYRLAVDLDRLSERTGPRWLFISHAYGGGVQQHVDDLAALIRDELDGVVWLLQPRDERSVRLTWCGDDSSLDIPLAHDQLSAALPELAAALGIQRLHFHHLAGLPASILELPTALGLPFDFTFHDFHTVCPQTHFISRDGGFCGRPDVSVCQTCVTDRPDPWGLGVEKWRDTFSQWLTAADRLIYPTASVRNIVTEYFPTLTGEVWPHPEPSMVTYQAHTEQSLARKKFCLIGSLSDVKGLHLLEEMVALVKTSSEPIDFVVVGPTLAPIGADAVENIRVTGQFAPQDLPRLLAHERPDGLLFLSIVPETYNYALSAGLATGLPIIALDAGAIGERLQGVAGAKVLPMDATAAEVLAVLRDIAGPYTLAGEPLLRDTVESNQAPYLRRHNQAVADSEKAAFQAREVLPLLQKVTLEAPALQRIQRGMAELLEQSLDCHLSEASSQLREQAIQNERQLDERNRHVDALGEELSKLEIVVGELKAAGAAETAHLKVTIKALKAAQIEEIEHLKSVIAELNGKFESNDLAAASGSENVAEIKVELERVQGALQQQAEHLEEREALVVTLADRIRELETSTFWRLTRPLRMAVDASRVTVEWVAARIEWLRRASVFIRYHYGHGGWPALSAAIRRRLKARPHYSEGQTDFAWASDVDVAGSDELVVLNTSRQPHVSIVIPTYGEHEVTRRCLASLAAHPLDMPCEVIVIDDAYAQPLDLASMRVEGARLVRHQNNLGFLRTCNEAVASAEGDYVLLLNNDTVVHPRAIEALLETFTQFEDVGAACAQLRFPDGTLQEAGGIVWSDGSAWNWGRGENPLDPRFGYPRDVDYGSAAALMVRRSLWNEVGGFDERFAPAYYEDTDLCFALRDAGHRVMYQPRAIVTHFEGVSHGTDTGSGMKAHQVSNQAQFTEKWRRVLAHHRANGVEPMLECDRHAAARILWVEACMLTPDQDSGSLRTIRLLRILVGMGCKVTYVADNMDGADPYRSQIEAAGVEVIHAPFFKSVGEYLQQHGREYDVITLCRHYIAIQHIRTVREVNPTAQIWFDTIDLHYLRSRRQFELDGKKSTADRAELAYREEMEVIGQSDLTIVVSEVEVEELGKEAPAARVAVVSNIHEISEVRAERQGRDGVVFVGGFQHPPNIDAVEFYVEEIWPLFREQCPGVPTYIIGSRMPDRLRKLGESHGLNMLGFVEDLMPYYMQSVLSIAPLRYGAGVKGKVNQALSYGLPVVGTSAALEGMGLEHGRQAMLADSAEAFASAMIEAYSDQALWRALSENGQQSLQDRFTPQVARDALEDALRAGVPGWADRRP